MGLCFARSVEEKRTSLLAGTSVEGVYDGQASEPESLRAKIQQGILALQEGLLERGTEVCSPIFYATILTARLLALRTTKHFSLGTIVWRVLGFSNHVCWCAM
jgi:hypothetical protein